MEVYYLLIKVAIKKQLQYSKSIIIFFIVNSMKIMLYYTLFNAIYKYNGTSEILGYTSTQMIWYFGLLSATWSLIWSSIDWQLSTSIINGNFAMELLKPISIFSRGLCESIGTSIISFFTEFLLLLLVQSFFIFPNFLNLISIIKYLVLLVFAFIMNYLINFICGIAAFVTTNIKSVINFKFMLFAVFGGSYIPLNFLPESIKNISCYLPFQYIIYWPIQFFINTEETSEVKVFLYVIINQILWILVLYIIYRILWKKAIKKYVSFGG